MKISHSNIDGKICNRKHARGKTGSDNNSGVIGYRYDDKNDATRTSQCSGLAAANGTSDEVGLNKFVVNAKVGEGETWPTGYIIDTGSSNKVNMKGETNSNAKAVATDLVNLNSDEKTIVAGLLAKTIAHILAVIP
ncbi:hypothetical protein AB9K21_00505 [Anaplasma phagocytophilum]|uniref:Putative p44-46 outer membrane protein, silent n=1 Tax=Anaplasma phagocytophilum str. ApNP TaxID=1359153 RepID=A0A0F3NIC1_ANAPH|nr:putative p44-46 outer membrane protein, silent [Anaplasma phagocytophilum str. ApNP]